MKITLHKPQREAANAVLAYDDEDVTATILNMSNAYCDWDIEGCRSRNHYDGDCTAITWSGDGYSIFTCFDE